jgi:hypothetical protein
LTFLPLFPANTQGFVQFHLYHTATAAHLHLADLLGFMIYFCGCFKESKYGFCANFRVFTHELPFKSFQNRGNTVLSFFMNHLSAPLRQIMALIRGGGFTPNSAAPPQGPLKVSPWGPLRTIRGKTVRRPRVKVGR